MNKLNISLIFIIFILFAKADESSSQLTGGWFEQLNPSGNNLKDVKFFDINNGIAIGNSGTILKTTDSGNNWNSINSGTINDLNSLSIIFPSTIYVAGDSGIILKSSDLGNTWITLNSQTMYNLNVIVFKSSESGFAAGNKGTILKTTNSGLTWNGTFSDTSARFYSLSYLNDNFVWAIGQERHPVYPGGSPIMINSSDFGLNWNTHEISDFYSGTSIYFLDTLQGFAFNCSTPLNYGVLRTSNGGLNWDCLWGGFFMPYNIHFVNHLTGFAIGEGSGNYALYKTTDAGYNWYASYIPYIYLYLKSAYFLNSETGWVVGNKLYKTTNGGGYLTTSNTSTSEIIKEFSLSQNYPNPFNPITKIKFDIPKTNFTKLSVYNSEGKIIETLYNGDLNGGTYEINFDGSNFPSGIYFYKLETGEYIFSKKMLLVK